MKKIILLLVVVIFIGGLYYYQIHKSPSQVNPGNTSDKVFQPDASNATFTFDDSGSTVTLSNGYNSASDQSTGLVQETKILKERATGDINADGKNDVALLLSQSGGGTGVFIYVAAYVSGPVSYKGTNAVLLGDRISPQKVSIANGIVTVTYLDRKPDEPYAADPTVPTTKQFVFKNGSLQEK